MEGPGRPRGDFPAAKERTINSICLFTCVLALAQAPDRGEWLLAPNLPPGLELNYTGTCTEESLVPHVVSQRQYRLELFLLTLASGKKDTEIAILTSLSRRDLREEPPKAKGKKGEEPWSVRLDLARLDMQGQMKGAGGTSVLTPLHGPPTSETGALVQFPLVRVSKNQTWEVNEAGRPSRHWTVLGSEVEGGVTCVKLLGQQQSADWDRPRADSTAWRRRDTVWINPATGVAQKVERVTERRDPARTAPTQRTTVAYSLENGLKYRGKLFEDRHNDIALAQKLKEEAAPLIKQPAMFKAQIEALHRRVGLSLEATAGTGSPYRKALLHLHARLESARKGELPPETAIEEPAIFPKAVTIGQRVPDVTVSELGGKNTTRLHGLLGKPVLIFFYNPAAESSREMLGFIQKLNTKHAGGLNYLAMAVTEDAALACKQRDDMALGFPIHEGRAFHATFGVDATPRMVLVDGDGVVRATHTGWGFQSPKEISDEVERCMPR